jgi:hypothetical protein
MEPKMVISVAIASVATERARGIQVLCKPKILPLKSVTLQKLEDMENRMAEASKRNAPGPDKASTL